MKSRVKILGIVVLALFAVGCGRAYSTDGKTVTVLGWGYVTDGMTSSEMGVGTGMNKNISNPRDTAFSDRSAAAIAALGGN